jgi:antitoxin CptB
LSDSAGRLRWRCRRGMKELDVLLLDYLEQHHPVASADEQEAFAVLLELPDPQLWSYLSGRETPADPRLSTLIDRIARPRH